MTDKDTQTSNLTPAEDTGFRARRLPGTPAGEARGMLPGMAMIGMFMLFVSLTGVFAVFKGPFEPSAKFVILPVCSMIVVGVFGFFRLRRWGWALLLAGCLLMACGYMFKAHAEHHPSLLVMAAFSLLFFLYLSRTEVRERLR